MRLRLRVEWAKGRAVNRGVIGRAVGRCGDAHRRGDSAGLSPLSAATILEVRTAAERSGEDPDVVVAQVRAFRRVLDVDDDFLDVLAGSDPVEVSSRLAGPPGPRAHQAWRVRGAVVALFLAVTGTTAAVALHTAHHAGAKQTSAVVASTPVRAAAAAEAAEFTRVTQERAVRQYGTLALAANDNSSVRIAEAATALQETLGPLVARAPTDPVARDAARQLLSGERTILASHQTPVTPQVAVLLAQADVLLAQLPPEPTPTSAPTATPVASVSPTPIVETPPTTTPTPIVTAIPTVTLVPTETATAPPVTLPTPPAQVIPGLPQAVPAVPVPDTTPHPAP